MPEKTVHCSICGKAIRGFDFQERMAKLRRHRKKKHPEAHRKSVKKMMKTKGLLDPLKVRKGLINKPNVEAFSDHKGSGLIRVLERKDGSLFPEMALYLRGRPLITESLRDGGLIEEARGKWVLRTNKFNIFVYV
jgi:hypothetical protein